MAFSRVMRSSAYTPCGKAKKSALCDERNNGKNFENILVRVPRKKCQKNAGENLCGFPGTHMPSITGRFYQSSRA
jgi:hypothetical protein